jgi:hypothetical protein
MTAVFGAVTYAVESVNVSKEHTASIFREGSHFYSLKMEASLTLLHQSTKFSEIISWIRLIFIPCPFVFRFDILTRSQAVLRCVVVFFIVEENEFRWVLTVSILHSLLMSFWTSSIVSNSERTLHFCNWICFCQVKR